MPFAFEIFHRRKIAQRRRFSCKLQNNRGKINAFGAGADGRQYPVILHIRDLLSISIDPGFDRFAGNRV